MIWLTLACSGPAVVIWMMSSVNLPGGATLNQRR